MNETLIDGQSLDVVQHKLDQLKQLLPEVFTEDKLDLEKFRLTLGEAITLQNERYVLNWAGKSDAFRVLQQPTPATLAPAPAESINFDTTQNIFIEGENLEVLKALQKAYFGQVKLIYIDPPYNTGSDHFIYPDRFAESKEDYLQRIEDKDEAGYLLREGLFRLNSKESGHFHSNWLSMMYPRLFLARNLLREDGVIFISIDDNEVHNLRLLMNEIFGEENFVAHIVWQKRYVSNVTAQFLSDMHDHILVYVRQKDFIKVSRLPRSEEQLEAYKNPDNDSRGVWRAQDLSASKAYSAGLFTITTPAGIKVNPPPGRYWRCNEEQYKKWLADNRIWFGKSGNGRPMLKAFLTEAQEGLTPNTWWDYSFAGHNKEATLEVKDLFDGASPFDTAKPVKLIRRMLELFTDPDALVMDFFAGSCTTAHAVLALNQEDGGNRQFICIQLPEKTDEGSEAYKAGYTTIADIGKERIRRVIHKIKANNPMFAGQGVDLGFKVFKLKPSNFKIWRGDVIESESDLAYQLSLFADPVRAEAQEENILYELILKSGYPLTVEIERKETYYRIADGELVIVLATIDEALVQEIIAQRPKVCLCLDKLFKGNDQLKTNTVLQMRDAGIKFATI